MSGTFKLSDVDFTPIQRMPTGMPYLDLIYGITNYTDKRGQLVEQRAGLPTGAVSLWAGEPGVGKSRLSVQLSASMNAMGYNVLYIQTEVSIQQFREWTAELIQFPNKFYVCTETTLEKQMEAFARVRPHLVVVDSLNMIQGHQSPKVIRAICEQYKAAVESLTASHVILIGHLNAKGEVKGNNDVKYLVDVECSLTKPPPLNPQQQARVAAAGASIQGCFFINMIKTRYGPTSFGGKPNMVAYRHTTAGVVFVTSNFYDPATARQRQLDGDNEEVEEPQQKKGLLDWLFS